MRKLFLLVFSLSTMSFAGTIILQPGESRTLKPFEQTIVVCQAQGEPLIDRFCNCRNVGPQYMVDLLKHYMYAGGKETVIKLGSYWEPSDCDKALRENPACK